MSFNGRSTMNDPSKIQRENNDPAWIGIARIEPAGQETETGIAIVRDPFRTCEPPSEIPRDKGLVAENAKDDPEAEEKSGAMRRRKGCATGSRRAQKKAGKRRTKRKHKASRRNKRKCN